MSAKARPAAPGGLGEAGGELWDAILPDLDSGSELDARNLERQVRRKAVLRVTAA